MSGSSDRECCALEGIGDAESVPRRATASLEGPLRVRNRDSLRFQNVRFDEDCCPRAKAAGVPTADLRRIRNHPFTNTRASSALGGFGDGNAKGYPDLTADGGPESADRLSHEKFVHELPPARTDHNPNWQSDQCFSVVPRRFRIRMTAALTASTTKMAIPIHSISCSTLPVPGGIAPVLPVPVIRGRSSTGASGICAPLASFLEPGREERSGPISGSLAFAAPRSGAGAPF
jgi:hypothetical protein